MKLKIIRGTNQIGGSIIEVSSGGTKIILDCGTNLPPIDDKDFSDPIDVPGLTSGKSVYDAVFITHYHNDHCGLLGRVNADITVYASQETANVLNVISDFVNSPPPRINGILTSGETVTIGELEVLPIPVRHSARGAFMFLISSPGGRMLYTGDFNHVDPTSLSLIKSVDVLLCEGTNLGRKAGITEADVEREAEKIMRRGGDVFVLSSSANIDRVKAICRASEGAGRETACDLFMHTLLDRMGTLSVRHTIGYAAYYIDKVKLPRQYKYLKPAFNDFVSCETLSKMQNMTVFIRATMGDFMERYNRFKPLKGSMLIYSMWEGYKENPKIRRFLELCSGMGMETISLHASGHAYRGQLEELISHLKPKALIPIHTENSGEFSRLHGNVVNLENGGEFAIGKDGL